MAVYTTITQTEAQQLFKPLGEIKKFEGIREGVENTNYLVHLDDSKKYILTIFEKRTNEKDLPYFNKLMKLFHKNGDISFDSRAIVLRLVVNGDKICNFIHAKREVWENLVA